MVARIAARGTPEADARASASSGRVDAMWSPPQSAIRPPIRPNPLTYAAIAAKSRPRAMSPPTLVARSLVDAILRTGLTRGAARGGFSAGAAAAAAGGAGGVSVAAGDVIESGAADSNAP